MWDLNTIVRMNDEAQHRADAMREHEAQERQSNEQQRVVPAGRSTTEGKLCGPKQAVSSR
jgi:hypothetical protein